MEEQFETDQEFLDKLVKIQALVRGYLVRQKFMRLREAYVQLFQSCDSGGGSGSGGSPQDQDCGSARTSTQWTLTSSILTVTGIEHSDQAPSVRDSQETIKTELEIEEVDEQSVSINSPAIGRSENYTPDFESESESDIVVESIDDEDEESVAELISPVPESDCGSPVPSTGFTPGSTGFRTPDILPHSSDHGDKDMDQTEIIPATPPKDIEERPESSSVDKNDAQNSLKEGEGFELSVKESIGDSCSTSHDIEEIKEDSSGSQVSTSKIEFDDQKSETPRNDAENQDGTKTVHGIEDPAASSETSFEEKSPVLEKVDDDVDVTAPDQLVPVHPQIQPDTDSEIVIGDTKTEEAENLDSTLKALGPSLDTTSLQSFTSYPKIESTPQKDDDKFFVKTSKTVDSDLRLSLAVDQSLDSFYGGAPDIQSTPVPESQTSQNFVGPSPNSGRDDTSIWDSMHSVDDAEVRLCGKDSEALHQLRDNVAMELLWIEQAIMSRKNFLRLKHKLPVT